MARMDNFRRQHGEVLQVIQEITGKLDPDWDNAEATQVSSLVANLLGKLKIHLAMEDDALYPELLQHPEQKVRDLATKYVNEMGSLKSEVDALRKKWGSASAIQADPTSFIRELQWLFAALRERVKKENDELYPLVDTLS